jgi:hypothetical protein
VNLGIVEIHTIYVHYVNISRYTTMVALIMVVSFTQLLYVLLVDRQLVDHLDPSGDVTIVWLGDLAGN